MRNLGIQMPVQPPANQPTIIQTAIRPPNLTDQGLKGLYTAAAKVPAAAIGVANQISVRIGAPGFSGSAATVQHMPSGGGGAPRPFIAGLPAPIRGGIARAKVFANGFGARLRRLPKLY